MRRFESERSSPPQQISNFQLATERSPASITVAMRPIFCKMRGGVASVIVFSARAAAINCILSTITLPSMSIGERRQNIWTFVLLNL